MKLNLALQNAQQAAQAFKYAWTECKPWLMAGHRLRLEIKPETRSNAQNRLLHSSIGDVAKQVRWAGEIQDSDVWKRLLTASWMRARGDSPMILPALDGQGVDVVIARTSKLTRQECTELIEFIHAWGTDQGVNWSPASIAMEVE